MAFKLKSTPSNIVRKVTIETANEKGGWTSETVSAVFAPTTPEELESQSGRRPREVMEEKLIRVDGLVDDDDQPITWDDDTKRSFLSIPAACVACYRALIEATVREKK